MRPQEKRYRRGAGAVVAVAVVLIGVARCAAQDDTTTSTTEPSSEFKPPNPPGASEFVDRREEMVETQIARPRFGGSAIQAKTVLEAMRKCPRHVFVPLRERSRAYQDSPLDIGHGQTISQPYVVALMTESLELTPESKVLEIGTGSGYQAAVLAHLTPHVYTIEIVKPLADRAKQTLEKQGYTTVECRAADGYFGWEEHASFDAIIVTCAAGHLPPPLWEQLKPDGRMVIPIGGPYEIQNLVVIHKTPEGERRSRSVLPVRFVPLTRGEPRDR